MSHSLQFVLNRKIKKINRYYNIPIIVGNIIIIYIMLLKGHTVY